MGKAVEGSGLLIRGSGVQARFTTLGVLSKTFSPTPYTIWPVLENGRNATCRASGVKPMPDLTAQMIRYSNDPRIKWTQHKKKKTRTQANGSENVKYL